MDVGRCVIHVDPVLALLSIVPVGFWDLATVAAHRDDFQRAVHTLNGRPYRVLVDSRRFAVQPSDVRTALHAFIASQQSIRTANVVSGSMLQRLQLRRVPHRNGLFRIFGAEQEALARQWLFETADDDGS